MSMVLDNVTGWRLFPLDFRDSWVSSTFFYLYQLMSQPRMRQILLSLGTPSLLTSAGFLIYVYGFIF